MKQPVIMIFMAVFIIGLILGDVPSVCAQVPEEFTLEEIVVTAQKREQDMQKVPIAMEAVEGANLVKMGQTTLKDALNTMASVTIGGVNENLSVTIRGMGNAGMPGDSFGMVAVNLDGVFSSNSVTGKGGLYDVSRIEVLAGPQGTLYSRNSGGGSVNMITNDPFVEEFDASGSVELGNYNTINTQGALNVPVNEVSAVRLAFATTDRDGYADNGADDNDTKSMRIKYLYNFNEDLSTVFSFENNKTGGKGEARGQVYKPFGNEDDATYPDGEPLLDPWHALYSGEFFHTDVDGKSYNMTLTWDTDIGTLTFLPHYSEVHREMSTPLVDRGTGELQRQDLTGQEKETSAELRMNSSEDSFATWVAGYYYYKKNWADDAHSVAEDNHNRLNSPSHAIFANLTYPASDIFRVTGGGRYTQDHERMSFIIWGNIEDEFRGGEDWDNKSSHFDYKLGVEYDVSEHSMLWADYSTGYQQGYRGNASQTLDAYQAGSKNRFLDQRLQMNATAYYYDYSNYGVRSMAEYVNPEGEVQMDMGSGTGDATLYGLDLTSDFILTQNDRINLSVSYIFSEINGLIITYMLGSPPSTEGNGLPFSITPEWTVNGGYKHYFYLGNGGTLTAGFDIRYRTKYYLQLNELIADPNNSTNEEQDHHMTNASLDYASPSGKWSINAYVKNIENYAEKLGGGMSNIKLAAPRTIGAVLSLRY